MEQCEIAIACGFGLEAVTQRELRRVLGIEHAPVRNGTLRMQGDMRTVAAANICLRTADHVYIVVGEMQQVCTFDRLFEVVSAMPWERYIAPDGALYIKGKSVDSALYGISACQSIVNKAIAVRLQKAYNLAHLPETGAQYAITVSLYKNTATLLLDTSGAGLHKRGYRTLVGEAAIKETMAAAILQLSVWHADKPLIDPFCGSGTFAIEAALMARNIAPGTMRDFAFEHWHPAYAAMAQQVRDEAVAAENHKVALSIQGYDINPEAIKLCRYHAQRAGVANDIHFQTRDMREMSSRHPYGVIVTNPPYGQRLLDDKQVESLMRDLWRVYRQMPHWSLYLITAYPFLQQAFGRKADKNRKLYNGKLECRLYQYMGEKPPKHD